MVLADDAISDETKKEVQEKLFTAWDNAEDTCDLTDCNIPVSQFEDIYQETINKNPKYFYVSGACSYSYSGDTNTITNVTIKYRIADKGQIKENKTKYETIVAQILKNQEASWSDAEKALYINDYLARNCQYGDASINDANNEQYSAYGALVNRTAVCQGYALAFMDLAQRMGLACELVTSRSLNHAWNLVKVDSSYYHVDVTWNDPTKDLIGRARHIYFLKSSDYFMAKSESGNSHQASDWIITGGVQQTDAAATNYDDSVLNSSNGLNYINGAWYGFNGTDYISKYTWSVQEGFQETDQVIKIDDVWKMDENTAYQDKYVGTGVLNGDFYYSGSSNIYKVDISSNPQAAAPVYALQTEETENFKFIYGLNVTPEGELQYFVTNDLEQGGEVRTLSDYSIVFDGNGSDSGTMSNMTSLLFQQTYTLPQNQYKKAGFCFAGWNTSKDGDGTGYKDMGDICFQSEENGSITLYAQWKTHGETEIRNKKEATCTEEGYTGDTYCKDCGELLTQGEAIAKLEHTPVTDEAVEATCTTEGKTQGSHCSVCSEVLTAQETIPASHSWMEDYTIDKEATETEAGSKSIHCSKCAEVKDVQEIPKLESGNPGTDTGNSGSTTTPGTGGSTTTPGTGGSTTTPGTGGSTTTPGNGNNTTTPGTGGSTTAPGTGGSTTTPGTGDGTTTPGNGDSTTAPGTGGNTTTPGTGAETPVENKVITAAAENADGTFQDASGKTITSALVAAADGTKYIADETGKKITDRVVTTSDGTMYCTGSDGRVAANKTVTLDGNKYFAKEGGVVARNEFCTTPYGNLVYAKENGTLAVDTTLTVDYHKYFAKKSGAIARNEFCTTPAGSLVYAKADRTLAVDTVVNINGSKYFAKKSGAIAKSQFCTTPAGSTVYAKADYTLAVNTVINIDGKKYYAKKSGAIAKGTFTKTLKGSLIYSKANGEMVTNRLFKVNGKRYYARKSGALAVKTWVKAGNKKYYCNASGVITKVKKM